MLAGTVNSFGSMEFSREALERTWPWAVRNYVCVCSNLYRPRLRPIQERAQKCLAEMQSQRESSSKLMWKWQWKYCGTCPRFCAETDKSHSREFNDFPGGVVKKLPASAGDLRDVDSVPGSGRPFGEGYCNPLWYSCLGNSHGQRSLKGDSP